MKRAFRGAFAGWCVLLAALLLGGCEAVLTQQPMGDQVVTLDAATWEGTWLGKEIVMVTTILNAEEGRLQAAWLERSSEGARFESATGTVRQSGDWLFLNMEAQQFEEDPPATGADAATDAGAPAARPAEFLWGRVSNDGRQVLLWWPAVEPVRQAVADGRLPGTAAEEEDVVLGPLDAAQMELLNAPAGNLLNWSEPLVFVRIGD